MVIFFFVCSFGCMSISCARQLMVIFYTRFYNLERILVKNNVNTSVIFVHLSEHMTIIIGSFSLCLFTLPQRLAVVCLGLYFSLSLSLFAVVLCSVVTCSVCACARPLAFARALQQRKRIKYTFDTSSTCTKQKYC